MRELEPIVIEKEDRVINPVKNVLRLAVKKELESYVTYPRIRFGDVVHYEKKEGFSVRTTPRLRTTISVDSIKALNAGIRGKIVDTDGGVISAYVFSNIDNFNEIVDSILFYPDGRILIAVNPDKLPEGVEVIENKYVKAKDVVRFSISMRITYEGNQKRNRTYGLREIDPKIAQEIMQMILSFEWPEEEKAALENFATNFFFSQIDELKYDTAGKVVILNKKEV